MRIVSQRKVNDYQKATYRLRNLDKIQIDDPQADYSRLASLQPAYGISGSTTWKIVPQAVVRITDDWKYIVAVFCPDNPPKGYWLVLALRLSDDTMVRSLRHKSVAFFQRLDRLFYS